MNRFRKSFRQKKKRPHRGTHGRSLIPFGLMTSSHEQKRTLFFFCPSVTLVLGYYSFISLEDYGCKISGLLTPSTHFFIFLNLGLKRENLEKKWKKRFFGWAKTGKHGYFCVTPTGLPDDFSGFYYFFPHRRHVSDVPFFTDELCRS